VEPGPAPLFVEPAVFEAHLRALAEAEAVVLTLAELVRGLREGTLPDRAVALTFDDGFASVVSQAAPRLRRRGWAATVFCVAGHLGETNDWPTQPAAVPRRRLATADEVAGLAAEGFEIGAHTLSHPPLSRLTGEALVTEVVGCQSRLEDLVGRSVRSFACPYGDWPQVPARGLLEQTYDSVCGTRLGIVRPDADPYALPRVDAHYVRSPRLLGRVVRGRDLGYLPVRRAGARARRLFASDSA
jgi:peptidoglycan/xylan/chitin deacetylase (PgdA/CDA1 family)